jgi:hypothetical protein
MICNLSVTWPPAGVLKIIAGVTSDFDTVEIVACDEIDHTGHRIGTVQTGSPVLQHFDPFEGDFGNKRIHVYPTVRFHRVAGRPKTIEQDKSRPCPETAKVDGRTAVVCVRVVASGVSAAGPGANVLGHHLEKLRRLCDRSHVERVGRGENRNRGSRLLERVSLDVRTSDFERFQDDCFGVVRLCLGARESGI